MGMDVIRYEVLRAVKGEEIKRYGEDPCDSFNPIIQCIDINERSLAWMKQASIDKNNIVNVKEFDWHAWFEENEQYKECEFIDGNVEDHDKDYFLHIAQENGSSILLDDGFIFKEVPKLYVEVQRVGYMRKPFRHSQAPSRVEGDTLILRVTNFSDEGHGAFEVLKNIDAYQTEECNVFIFNESDVEKLKSFSYDKKAFDKALLCDWKSNHYVLFNW